jgi:hypothetical protein
MILRNEGATVLAVSHAVSEAATRLNAGDTFFLSFAGHGSQLFDSSNDEPDSLDETWCLYDRMILDDELNGLYFGFAPGVRVLLISDSCHSGTIDRVLEIERETEFDDPRGIAIPYPPAQELVFRALSEQEARTAFRNDPDRYAEAAALASRYAQASLKCSLQLFAACQDNQLAADGAGHGYFTQQLLYHWQGGAFQGSYDELFQAIERAMPKRQKPNRDFLGEPVAAFISGRPFST